MKPKNVALNGLLYFLYVIGACILVRVVESMLVSFIGKLIVQFTFPAWIIFCMVIFTLGVPALLAFLGYGEGYREGACSVPDTMIGCAMAMVPHLLLAMLFKFHTFIAGAVRPVAGFLFNGMRIDADNLVNATPYWLFLAMFLAYWVLYAVTLTVSKYLGAQKRIINRADLRRHEVSTRSESESESEY